MPTTCSSMPGAIAFTSVAAPVLLIFRKRKKRPTGGSRVSPQFTAHARRSLCPRWIVSLLPAGRAPESRQPSGYSGRCLELVGAALRTGAWARPNGLVRPTYQGVIAGNGRPIIISRTVIAIVATLGIG